MNRPLFAWLQARASAIEERRGGAERRRQLLDGLSGVVVEIGAGSGVSFAHYPTSVREVIAVEPEPCARERAVEAAQAARVPVRVVDGFAEQLPLADGSVDVAVTAGVLCSVPDQSRALAEVARVLRPGGELRFYEHVIANRQPKRAILQLADRTRLWPTIAGGCHVARDTTAATQAADFTIEHCEHFDFSASAMQPNVPHILGTARRT